MSVTKIIFSINNKEVQFNCAEDDKQIIHFCRGISVTTLCGRKDGLVDYEKPLEDETPVCAECAIALKTTMNTEGANLDTILKKWNSKKNRTIESLIGAVFLGTALIAKFYCETQGWLIMLYGAIGVGCVAHAILYEDE
jgi:hypothetical protein